MRNEESEAEEDRKKNKYRVKCLHNCQGIMIINTY